MTLGVTMNRSKQNASKFWTNYEMERLGTYVVQAGIGVHFVEGELRKTSTAWQTMPLASVKDTIDASRTSEQNMQPTTSS